MRISDWSSDVCSSDLQVEALGAGRDLAVPEFSVRCLAGRLLDAPFLAGDVQQHALGGALPYPRGGRYLDATAAGTLRRAVGRDIAGGCRQYQADADWGGFGRKGRAYVAGRGNHNP